MEKLCDKKRNIDFLLIIAIVQVILLISSVFANGYIVSEIFYEGKNYSDEIINTGSELIKDFFSIKQIGSVSALGSFCCEKTIEGEVCVDMVAESSGDIEDSCAEGLIPTSCAATTNCQKGCCIDTEYGLCTPRSSKDLCENQGGYWDEEETCTGIPICEKGCCQLGNNFLFVTQKYCEHESSLLDTESIFDSSSNKEMACLYSSESENKGACVIEVPYEKNTCTIETRNDCENSGGSFYDGSLCTDNYLNTICEPTEETTCLDSLTKKGVYFVDSCGNIANIYDASKVNDENYWKTIIPESESCSIENNLARCGNCNFHLGSTCNSAEESDIKPTYGDNICISTNCKNAPARISSTGEVLETSDRKNGESWCLYDSGIGVEESPFGNNISVDPVGSLHWRASCINGEVEIEKCGDYRNSLCAQSDIEDPNSGKTFSIGSCVVNEAVSCIMINNQVVEECGRDKNCRKEYMQENCIDNPQCNLRNVIVDDDGFYFSSCVPAYPGGFKLKEASPDQQSICSLGNKNCIVTYKKDWQGDWDCVENCNCVIGSDPSDSYPSESFTTKLNDFCVSLGDCGSYVNYIGEGTENIKVAGQKEDVAYAKPERYSKFSEAISGKFVETRLSPELLAQMLGRGSSGDWDENELENLDKLIQGIEGAGAIAGLIVGTKIGAGVATAILGEGKILASVGGYMQFLAVLAIGAGIATLFANYMGYSEEATTLAAIGGAVLAYYVYYIWYIGGSWGPVGWIVAAIVSVVLLAWGSITGYGDIKTKTIQFECLPWQAPVGSTNCELCNDDSLGRACTEYKCNSLGQNCEFINENTDNPECITTTDDGVSPMIEPTNISEGLIFDDKQSTGVKIKSETSREDAKACVNIFTPLEFTLETDEYAQCKFSLVDEVATTFDEYTGDYPNKDNAFTNKHKFVLNFPSIDFISQRVEGEFNDELRQMYSNMRLYVRCQDSWGNYNVAPYLVEFCVSEDDLTAVSASEIIFSPSSGSYIKYGATEQEVKMTLPEPATCKYSEYSDVDYELMANEMACENSLIPTGNGWVCNTTLYNLTESNDIYIKCNDSAGNVNNEDIEYNLFVSQSELSINSIEVHSEENVYFIEEGKVIESGVVPTSIDLVVNTDGGAQQGVALCYYTFDMASCKNPRVFFFETYSTRHSQTFNQILGGDYNVCIKCQDNAGNKIFTNASFEVNIDDEAPMVTRVYERNEKIIINTNEEALCIYDEKDCNFEFDLTNYTIGYSNEHVIDAENGKKYYVKCQDIWGNINSGCASIVRLV